MESNSFVSIFVMFSYIYKVEKIQYLYELTERGQTFAPRLNNGDVTLL